MFELRDDIPLPNEQKYPFKTMKVGQCLVFQDEASFRSARRATAAFKNKKFRCEEMKIWLVDDGWKNLEDKIMELLQKNGEMSFGILRNRMRKVDLVDVADALDRLESEGVVARREKIHSYTKQKIVMYVLK